jgi:putative flavoprotein involved in K+ transport
MFDVLVIGAGQAGLAASYSLTLAGLHFLVLEARSVPTGSWPQYYDSLRLFSPARYSSLPGLPFPGKPNRYPLRDEVSAYLHSYAQHFQFPIRFNQNVSRLEQDGSGFLVTTAMGEHYQARAIIIATGPFRQPALPDFPGQNTFRGQILHSSDYHRPDPFQGQRVLVVGAGNSAVQIAVEVAQHAQVTLTSRTPVRFVPQHPLGQDIHFWLWLLGIDRLALPSLWQRVSSNPVLDAGPYQAALTRGKLDWRLLFERFTPDGVVWTGGREEAIDCLILATGYRFQPDYLANLGIYDERGQVLQQAGRSLSVPGLFYVGLPFQRTYASATLRGVGPDADLVVRQLMRWLRSSVKPSVTDQLQPRSQSTSLHIPHTVADSNE